MKNIIEKGKIFWYMWGIFFVITLADFVYVIGIRKELLNEAPTALGLIFLGAFGLGILSFMLGVVVYAIKATSQGGITLGSLIRAGLVLLIFPIYFIVNIIRSFSKKKLKGFDQRYALTLGVLTIVLPFWILGYFLSYMGATRVLGLRYYLSHMLESESMAPSFPGGSIHKSYQYKNIVYKINPNWAYKFKRGDVVSFSNETTQKMIAEAGVSPYLLLKRIVGVSGDKIEIKGGVVFLNGQPLEEPYTLEPNSTFEKSQGELNGHIWLPFLKDCEEIMVPAGKLFVLGDNRKNSDDSRVIGFVDTSDVVDYLPYEEQKTPYYEGVTRIEHDEKWRDASRDITSAVIQKTETECASK